MHDLAPSFDVGSLAAAGCCLLPPEGGTNYQASKQPLEDTNPRACVASGATCGLERAAGRICHHRAWLHYSSFRDDDESKNKCE